ncbi:MAG: YdcF family protein [Xanthobacteraceae bacterium]|nr:MAG: YdcF family protein [Xanthobacteraceae bacterium]
MFFFLSKILGFFIALSNVAACLGFAGLVLLLTPWRRWATGLMAASVALIVLFGLSPLGDVLMLGLSERYPPWREGGREPDGIVVLGGAISPEISAARGAVELNAAAERMTAAITLARQFPRARIVFSGGNANLVDNSTTEAEFARALWVSAGIAPERITLEDRSRTTAENAVFALKAAAPGEGERWLLVTSAHHMPRAMAAFQGAGFTVEAYPVDWRTRGWDDALIPFHRVSTGLARSDAAVHEWVGLLMYRLSGRTRELVPGPD